MFVPSCKPLPILYEACPCAEGLPFQHPWTNCVGDGNSLFDLTSFSHPERSTPEPHPVANEVGQDGTGEVNRQLRLMRWDSTVMQRPPTVNQSTLEVKLCMKNRCFSRLQNMSGRPRLTVGMSDDHPTRKTLGIIM